MPLRPGAHSLGPPDGSLEVRTYREGLAQGVGHDLRFTVGRWRAHVEVTPEGRCSGVRLDADPDSLELTEATNGVKPLTRRDRDQILRTIAQRILRGGSITFASSRIEEDGDRLSVSGDLSLGGRGRPASFAVTLDGDGRVHGVLPVVQSEWGIKPYSALLGALKVRDTVDVVLDLRLPVA